VRTYERTERLFQNIHGSLEDKPNADDVVSGSFRVIRVIAVLPGRGAMKDG